MFKLHIHEPRITREDFIPALPSKDHFNVLSRQPANVVLWVNARSDFRIIHVPDQSIQSFDEICSIRPYFMVLCPSMLSHNLREPRLVIIRSFIEGARECLHPSTQELARDTRD